MYRKEVNTESRLVSALIRRLSRRSLPLGAAALMLALAACTQPDGTSEFNDPYETTNRAVHDFNKSSDTRVLRPLSQAYVTVVPEPVQDSVINLAENIELPGVVVNNLLQFDLDAATRNTVRFAINTVFGIGGIFDPADVMGLREVSSDFGETLYVWGVPEGAYIELPLLGPSTERAAFGRLVDTVTNPLTASLPSPERYYGTGLKVVKRIDQRGRFGSTLDSILYDSADSYAQSRLLYLQNRRFELGDTAGDAYFDPYEDPYDF